VTVTAPVTVCPLRLKIELCADNLYRFAVIYTGSFMTLWSYLGWAVMCQTQIICLWVGVFPAAPEKALT